MVLVDLVDRVAQRTWPAVGRGRYDVWRENEAILELLQEETGGGVSSGQCRSGRRVWARRERDFK